MKKIFAMMLLVGALFVSSCNKDDEYGYVGNKYTGDMTVTLKYMGSSIPLETQSNVSFYFTSNTTDATVTLAQVSFTKGLAAALSPFYTMESDPYMPSLDIVLPNIPYDAGIYTASSITPCMLDYDPYDNTVIQSVTDVVAQYYSVTDAILVTFDCAVITEAMNGAEITFSVSFTGTR